MMLLDTNVPLCAAESGSQYRDCARETIARAVSTEGVEVDEAAATWAVSPVRMKARLEPSRRTLEHHVCALWPAAASRLANGDADATKSFL